MNFDFSEDLNLLREQARRFLTDRCSTRTVRDVFESERDYDQQLWQDIAKMGWQAAAIPEELGGVGLGHEGLCVLAEELGRALAPLPFASSVYLATEAIVLHGSAAQKASLLPRLASGEAIGTFALAEGIGNPRLRGIQASVKGGRLNGCKWPVPDGSAADFALVAARDESGGVALFHVDLQAAGVKLSALQTLDPSRQQSRMDFDNVVVERLGTGPFAWSDIEHLLDRAAVLMAFEQLGGASVCLETATTYAKQRHAFGRPIGSFQAIKHKLADVFIANELARSNAYYGAWALNTNAPELPRAAAAARISASTAYHLASKENIQTHGGMGFTWEMDCHLYYRRSKLLSAALGSPPHWKERLISQLELQAEQQLQAAA